MASKPTKIVDIQSPSEVTAGATGRPLVVTSRPVLAHDPMVTPSGDAKSDDKPAEPVTRTAKTIKPLEPSDASRTLVAEDKAASAPSLPPKDAAEPADEPVAAPDPAVSPVPVEASETADKADEILPRDAAAESKAAASKAEAAQLAREQELEELIASGKYQVPINAAARRRSRTNTLLLSVCALLLALALLDVVLDMGLIKLPVSLPHTSFFK